MSAPQFSVKRRFINGQNDWRYQQTKAPVTTSDDQYIYGVKQFADPLKALGDVMCSGFYYGDGSQLTNIPSGSDPTKLPLTGGTLTGSLTVDAPGIISGNGSGLTGIVATDSTKLPLAGGTLTGPLINSSTTQLNGSLTVNLASTSTFNGPVVTNGITCKTSLQVNNAVAGQNSTLNTQQLVVNNGSGGTLLPVATWNQTNNAGGSLVEETYNQKAPATGEFNRHSYFAKNGAGNKVEYARIHQNVANSTTGNTKGRIDFDVQTGNTLSNLMSINGNSNQVDIKTSLHLNNNPIVGVYYAVTPNGCNFAPQRVNFLNHNSSTYTGSKDTNERNVFINLGVPDTLTPINEYFPNSIWAIPTASYSNYSGYTWAATDDGRIYYTSGGSGFWTDVGIQLDGHINCMIEYNGELYIGGKFGQDNVSSTQYSNILKITGSLTATQVIWGNYGSNGLDRQVRCFEVANGRLFLGGDFEYDTSYNLNVRCFAIMDSGYSLYPIDNVSGNGFDAPVQCIKSDQGSDRFVIGGDFNTFYYAGTGWQASYWIHIDFNSAPAVTNWSPMPISLGAPLRQLAQNGNMLYAGGAFTSTGVGDFIFEFYWTGSSWQIDAFTLGTAVSPVNLLFYSPTGVLYWGEENGDMHKGNSTTIQNPFSGTGAVWSTVCYAVWGQDILSTNYYTQNPTTFYFLNDNDSIEISIVDPVVNGGAIYTNTIYLPYKGASIELIWSDSDVSWYVVSNNGATFN